MNSHLCKYVFIYKKISFVIDSVFVLGISVFHLSIAHGSEDLILLILQTLLRGGVSRLSMESVLSPFSVALLFNRSSILTMLMSKSFNINAATLNTGK